MSAKRVRLLGILGAAIALGGLRAACAEPVIPGSTAYCLYEVPTDEPGKRRWINLAIVQYVEATRTELKIFYGGGSFGAGHEARIPLATLEEGAAIMEKLRKAAAACR
jgi:hypothetical protein